MKIDSELIKKVAVVARLNLKKEEVEKFTQDFKDILNSFSIIDKADVTGVKSSFRPIENKNVLRDDVVQESISNKDALKFTVKENKENGFFIGPRTIG